MAKSTIKKEERVTPGRRPLSRQLRLYQHIAVGFVGVTFLLLLAVLYLSVSRATIRVVPNPDVVKITAGIDIVPEPGTEADQVKGVVAGSEIKKSRVFTLPAEGAREVEEKASGYVTLINETVRDQPLVASTRVLAESGVLFRLEDYVVVPANGQIEAYVKADQPGKNGEIGPGKFTIPGLGTALQAQIYGVSVSSMTGGVQYVRALTEADIATGVEALSAEILSEAKQTLTAAGDLTAYDGEVFLVQTIEQTTDVTPGTETGAFSLTLAQNVVTVYYSTSDVQAYAEGLLASEIPEGFRLSLINWPTATTDVGAVNAAAGEARLTVTLDGLAVLSEDAQILDKERFIGRAPHEVLTLLRSSAAVKDVSVSFTPFWLKRVPTLQDHIRIIIEEPKN